MNIILQSLFYSIISLICWFVQYIYESKHSRRTAKQLATEIWSSGRRSTPWFFKMYPFISSTTFLWWVMGAPGPPGAHSLSMTQALRDSLSLVCDNHDGVITDLEPDILECEVKWALESITTNKASGGDGIPVGYLKSWKMMLRKCCTQYASKFAKLSSGHRTGKGQFSFQYQRRAMLKNAQTMHNCTHLTR